MTNYIELFPAYTRDKPKFAAFASALLRQAEELITLVQEIAPGFSFAGAVGLQLDAIGESVGIPRQEGWEDEVYRKVLLRKLKRFTWDGMNESVAEFLEAGESLKDNGNGSVSVTCTGPLPAKEMLPIPIGVKALG